MNHILIALASSLTLIACSLNDEPARLPPTSDPEVSVPQWEEYCAREGVEDPACVNPESPAGSPRDANAPRANRV